MKAATDLDRWRNPPIQRLLGTATVLAGNHQNKVWRGITQVPGNVEAGIPTVIKWIEKKEVVATELACSLAGQAFKLQIPVGCIVLAEPSDLPTLPDTGDCIRSEDSYSDLVGTFEHQLSHECSAATTRKLLSFTTLRSLAGCWKYSYPQCKVGCAVSLPST